MRKTVRLAVTLGDPAGIGPEVTEKAARLLLAEEPHAELVLVGPRGIADALADRLGSRVTSDVQAPFAGPLATPSAESGRAALAALQRGVELVRARAAHALVTAPLSKAALALAGSEDRGHTEILARELGRGGPVAMAFFAPSLRTVLATTHVALREAIERLTPERIVEVTRLLHEALQDQLGLVRPRLALAALNPHAGEGGLMGDEEARVLAPAVEACRAEGIDLSGPVPADAVFRRAVEGAFEGVVALYHDQALIPVKLLGFGDAVNVTLGLVAPRTSPDHGTAFDIAGRGLARPHGMLGALRLGAELGMGAKRRG